VLVVGTTYFPKDSGSGYTSETLIWLLNQLGFRTTLWYSRNSLNAGELSAIGFTAGKYDAAFLCDVGLLNQTGLMQTFKTNCLATNTRGYILSKAGGIIGGNAGQWAVGALPYTEYWQPVDTICGMLTTTLASGDTLWLHDYGGTTRLVEKLIWKAGEGDTARCLMWRWNTLITLVHCAPNPDMKAFLVISQFIRDKGYSPYIDYVPLPLTFQLDADGMASGPSYCGTSSLPWIDLVDSLRATGIKYAYFAPYETGFATGCDTMATAWPLICDVLKIGGIHAPANGTVWSTLTADTSMQRAEGNGFENFRARLEPDPDSTLTVLQCHLYQWSIMNAKFFLGHGAKVLGAMDYTNTLNSNTYVQRPYLLQHTRLRPSSITHLGTTGWRDSLKWVQITAFRNELNANPSTYTDFYALHASSVPGLTFGFLTSTFVYWYTSGYQPYQHVDSLKGDPLLSRCWIHGVLKPWLHATQGLWELNDTPENLKRLAFHNLPSR
jgi:hypothetical protein